MKVNIKETFLLTFQRTTEISMPTKLQTHLQDVPLSNLIIFPSEGNLQLETRFLLTLPRANIPLLARNYMSGSGV